MKVKIQSGHLLNREDLVAFLKKLPGSWTREFEKVIVYESAGAELVSSFARNEKLFGIHIPKDYQGQIKDVFDEVSITLQAVRDYGHIPGNIPSSRVKEYMSAWNEISNNTN